MRITEFKSALDRLSVLSHSKHPILLNVHCKSDGRSLTLTTTDLNQFTSTRLAAEGEPFEITAPHKLLKDWLRAAAASIPDYTTIELSTIDKFLRIKSASFDYRFAGMDAENYPEIPQIESAQVYEFDREHLANSLKAALKIASRDAHREPLTGVGFRILDGTLTIAATDGHRFRYERQDVLGEDVSTVISKSAIDALAKCKGKTVELQITAEAIGIEVDGTTIASRALEGVFPWESIDKLNRPLEQSIAIDRRLLIGAIDRVSREKGTAIVLTADAVIQQVSVCGTVGEEFIPARMRMPGIARLNPVYLLDSLKGLTSTEVLIELGGDSKITRITPLGGNSVLYGIMGILVKDQPLTPPQTASTGESVEVAIEPLETPTTTSTGSSEAVYPDHPESGTLEPVSTEAFDRLREQLTEPLPMPEYVIPIEKIKEAVAISLRPDTAYKLAIGIDKMILIANLDPEEFDLEGQYCLIHAAQVEGAIEAESFDGFRALGKSPDFAPAGSILAYGIIGKPERFNAKSWVKAREDDKHSIREDLDVFKHLAGITGEVWGVPIHKLMLLADPVYNVSGEISDFWSPATDSPYDATAWKSVFEVDRDVIDVEDAEKEFYAEQAINKAIG